MGRGWTRTRWELKRRQGGDRRTTRVPPAGWAGSHSTNPCPCICQSSCVSLAPPALTTSMPARRPWGTMGGEVVERERKKAAGSPQACWTVSRMQNQQLPPPVPPCARAHAERRPPTARAGPASPRPRVGTWPRARAIIAETRIGGEGRARDMLDPFKFIPRARSAARMAVRRPSRGTR